MQLCMCPSVFAFIMVDYKGQGRHRKTDPFSAITTEINVIDLNVLSHISKIRENEHS